VSAATVVLLAGEPSGDVYAGALAAELGRLRPELRLVGTGGPHMAAAGVELVANLEDLAVMGFLEVAGRLLFFRRLEREIDDALGARGVRLAVLVDYPGLNLRIARRARARGIPVLYYVPPKVWASRPGRVQALAEHTDRVAVVLPFEAEYLAARGVRATFVGHPLLDRPDDVAPRDAFCRRWRLDEARPILALLPGSRRQELGRHLDLFMEAAERIRAERPEVQPVVGRAAALPAELFARTTVQVADDVRGLLRHARAALLKSGTVTLEAALEGTPGVVAYRTSALTWQIAKRLLRVEHVALPNLVAGERVMPELLQGAATPTALAGALSPLLDAECPERCRQLEGLARVRSAMGAHGATRRVADMALALLDRRA
jgi:lipid-A-disaccharide synthase